MRGRLKSCLAIASLLIIGVTETAPHRHNDSLFEGTLANTGTIFSCTTRAPFVAHLHRAQTRQIDPCIACLRQHLQASAWKLALGTPETLERFLIVAARVAYADAIRARKSSRAPPTLVS